MSTPCSSRIDTIETGDTSLQSQSPVDLGKRGASYQFSPVVKGCRTNVDIVEKIASYMSPNPVELTRLALVNRSFYTVFTRDEMWLPYDVYARKKNIFEHFTELIPSYGKLMELCWAEDKDGTNGTDLEKFPVEKVENKYVQMGYYTRILTQNKTKKIQGIHIGDALMVELLLDLGSFAFANERLRDNKVLALKACTRFNKNIDFVREGLHQVDFYCSLIDETLNGGQIPYPEMKLEQRATIIEYAWEVNPSVVAFWISLCQYDYPITQTIVSKFSYTDEELSQVLSGAPQGLDSFEDYWQNREFCLEVFSSKGFQQAGLPYEFLKQCTDRDIIVRALENYPASLFHVPEEFREDKDTAMLALCSASTCNAIKESDWARYASAAAQLPWTDSEVLGRVVDMGEFSVARKYSSEVLKRCCKNAEWVKDRLEAQPGVWNEIAVKLQRDRSLLMTALKSKRRLAQEGRPCKNFVMNVLPAKFHNDEELLLEAALANALGVIFENDINEAIIKAQMLASLSGERLP